MATTEPEQQISLKLVVIKERNKVVFAEAEKDFVDVLISLLTLPLGTIVRLVREESNMQPIEVGSLTSLYRSVENPDKEFLSTDSCKQMILRPKNSMERYCKRLKLKMDDTEPTEYFVYVEFVDPILNRKNCKNIVKGPTMYMATDDLVVTPMTATSVISLLATMSIPFSDLEEKEFSIGIKEAVGILQASLTSKSALTTALCHLLTQIKQEN
ncbi:uncharacterized protein HKW66_Vig0117170 [Vigna angularis]|uniref:DUF674 domain-containing protein n=1 Tax=Phaseolus angularis TaxID=3914 RepID=A0A8T0JVJ5_PHAAN|nr:uncharacterized protein HKW66_Vig0117170 [Vigna angularis]